MEGDNEHIILDFIADNSRDYLASYCIKEKKKDKIDIISYSNLNNNYIFSEWSEYNSMKNIKKYMETSNKDGLINIKKRISLKFDNLNYIESDIIDTLEINDGIWRTIELDISERNQNMINKLWYGILTYQIILFKKNLEKENILYVLSIKYKITKSGWISYGESKLINIKVHKCYLNTIQD